jgi:hypothetical protein
MVCVITYRVSFDGGVESAGGTEGLYEGPKPSKM